MSKESKPVRKGGSDLPEFCRGQPPQRLELLATREKKTREREMEMRQAQKICEETMRYKYEEGGSGLHRMLYWGLPLQRLNHI